jgi:hypothetical protein
MSPNPLNSKLTTGSPIDLPRRSMLKLPDAAAVQIDCRSGSLWITLDGDTRDFIVEAGERFTTDARRPAIVYALQPATLLVQPQRPAAWTRAATWRWPQVQQPVAVR